jgi:hypothetical protein
MNQLPGKSGNGGQYILNFWRQSIDFFAVESLG